MALLVLAACARRSEQQPAARVRTAAGTEARWRRADIELEPVLPGASTGVSGAVLRETLATAARAWNDALSGCDVPRLTVGALVSHGAARTDGRNEVVLRTDTWCPVDSVAGSTCAGYDRSEEAKTHLRTREPDTGEIVEADLEVNAIDWRWGLDGGDPQRLRAVLAHELGHVLGLADVCDRRARAESDARATRSCATPSVRSSIMYADPAEPGRVLVLDPTPDAVAALCAASVHTAEGGGAAWEPR